MKWHVVFREKKRNCCPPGEYWAVKDTVVVANNPNEVEQKLKKGRISVEVQKITPHE